MAILAGALLAAFGVSQTPNEQGWEKAAGGKMEFEVASVRLNPGPMEPANFRLSPDDAYANTGGLLTADFPLVTYIEFAYKIHPTREQAQTMFAHVPQWVQTDNYDIHARAGDQNPTKDQMRLMMQALLRERFGLAAHYEIEGTPVLEMSLDRPGKLGPNLHRHEDGPACNVAQAPAGGAALKDSSIFPAKCGGIEARSEANHLVLLGGRDTTLEMIANSFSIGRLGRPVVDETGLTGKYDFTLKWAPEPGTFGTGPRDPSQDALPVDQQGSTFLEAIKDQLGFRLKAGEAPLQIFVIDHVERPSEN